MPNKNRQSLLRKAGAKKKPEVTPGAPAPVNPNDEPIPEATSADIARWSEALHRQALYLAGEYRPAAAIEALAQAILRVIKDL